MLSWQFFIKRQVTNALGAGDFENPTVATWESGWGGTDWIEHLVEKGSATDLGGNGYPCRYLASAAVLFSTLQHGVPKHTGPPVIGDDYFLPGGWTGKANIDLPRLRELDASEILVVEAWDQS